MPNESWAVTAMSREQSQFDACGGGHEDLQLKDNAGLWKASDLVMGPAVLV